MKFRTEISIKDAPKNLSPERLVLLMGSCFSDNIGDRMIATGWPAVVNPCGVIYNPVSMAKLFRLALMQKLERREIVASSITTRDGKGMSSVTDDIPETFVSWLMSSKAVGESAEGCINKVCECIDILEEGIEKADAIILTFGTSDVWFLSHTDYAVGNCHKHPATEFEKRRIGVDETVSIWNEVMVAVRERNPEVKFIFTVSPRRYLSDGFAENTRQKAVLILACEQLCTPIHSTTTNPSIYFPAYEILNDDLRDYRFYSKDLLHPSEMAIDYVWEKFTDTFLTPAGKQKLLEMEKGAKRKMHIKK